MVLGRGLTDADGCRHAMAGLLPLETSFRERRLSLGYRHARLAASGPLGAAGTSFRGHEFHYCRVVSEETGRPLFETRDATGASLGHADDPRLRFRLLHPLDRPVVRRPRVQPSASIMNLRQVSAG